MRADPALATSPAAPARSLEEEEELATLTAGRRCTWGAKPCAKPAQQRATTDKKVLMLGTVQQFHPLLLLLLLLVLLLLLPFDCERSDCERGVWAFGAVFMFMKYVSWSGAAGNKLM